VSIVWLSPIDADLSQIDRVLPGQSADLRDAPVEHQHFTKRSDHDVLRFEIAMNHAVRVRESYRVANSLKLSQSISQGSA
jgi:hypothetical protein